MAPAPLASRLAVERISAQGTAGQPLKEVPRSPQPKSSAGAVFAELLLRCGEKRFLNNGWRRNKNPLPLIDSNCGFAPARFRRLTAGRTGPGLPSLLSHCFVA